MDDAIRCRGFRVVPDAQTRLDRLVNFLIEETLETTDEEILASGENAAELRAEIDRAIAKALDRIKDQSHDE